VSAIELDDLIDELEDIIDRMRVAIPEEHKRARRIVQEQERLIAEAQARVQQVLEERGLLEAVEQERARLLQQAEQEAVGVRAGADEYARQVLEELDERLTKLVTSVRNGLSALGGTGDDPLKQA
jgi:DNA repair exonuclease SbcCD ATPase subunit